MYLLRGAVHNIAEGLYGRGTPRQVETGVKQSEAVVYETRGRVKTMGEGKRKRWNNVEEERVGRMERGEENRL